MKMQKRREKGFTLLEVIIAFTLIAIVGTMLYTYMGTSMTKSSAPLSRLQMSLSLQQIMENITADYPKNYAFDLPGLQAALGAEGTNQDNGYGQYAVFENHFITFVANQEQTGGPTDGLLKVTIRNSNNESLTKIYVQ